MNIKLNRFGFSLSLLLKKILDLFWRLVLRLNKKYRILLSSFNGNKMFYNNISLHLVCIIFVVFIFVLFSYYYYVSQLVLNDVGFVGLFGVLFVGFIPLAYLCWSKLVNLFSSFRKYEYLYEDLKETLFLIYLLFLYFVCFIYVHILKFFYETFVYLTDNCIKLLIILLAYLLLNYYSGTSLENISTMFSCLFFINKLNINKSILEELKDCWEVLKLPNPHGGRWSFQTQREKLETLDALSEKLNRKKDNKEDKDELTFEEIRETLDLPDSLTDKDIKKVEDFIFEGASKVRKFVSLIKESIKHIISEIYKNIKIILSILDLNKLNYVNILNKYVIFSILFTQLISVSTCMCLSPLILVDNFVTNWDYTFYPEISKFGIHEDYYINSLDIKSIDNKIEFLIDKRYQYSVNNKVKLYDFLDYFHPLQKSIVVDKIYYDKWLYVDNIYKNLIEFETNKPVLREIGRNYLILKEHSISLLSVLLVTRINIITKINLTPFLILFRKLNFNKINYINKVKYYINNYIIFSSLVFLMLNILEVVFTPCFMLSVLPQFVISDALILSDGDVFSNNSTGGNITVLNSLIISNGDVFSNNSDSNLDVNLDANLDIIGNDNNDESLTTNESFDSDSDNESDATDFYSDNETLVNSDLDSNLDSEDERDIDLIREIEMEVGDYNVEDMYGLIFYESLMPLLIIRNKEKIRNILKILILFIIKLVIFKLLTIFLLSYLLSPILENISLCMNLPILSTLIKGKNKLQSNNECVDFEDLSKKIVDYDSDKITWARFILKNKYFNVKNIDKLTDVEILDLAASWELIDNKNIVNITTDNKDLNDKHVLSNSELGILDIKKTKNNSNESIETLNLEEDCNDNTNFISKFKIDESSSFLLDLTNLIKDSALKIYSKFNSASLKENNNELNNTILNNKLEEYFKWSSNLKNNLGINFEDSVNNELTKNKSMWFDSLISFKNNSLSSLSIFTETDSIWNFSNYFNNSNSENVLQSQWFDTDTENGLQSQWFDTDSDYSNFSKDSVFVSYSIFIIFISKFCKTKKNIPFFFTNKIQISLSFKNKIIILTDKIKKIIESIKLKIINILKRLILIFVFRYLLTNFLIPLFSLFLIDFSIFFSVLPINLNDFDNENCKPQTEARLKGRKAREWREWKNENVPQPQQPFGILGSPRKSLARLSQFTDLTINSENNNPISKKIKNILVNSENNYDQVYQQEQERLIQQEPKKNNTVDSSRNILNFKNFFINSKNKILDNFYILINKLRRNKKNNEDEEELLEQMFWRNEHDNLNYPDNSQWFDFHKIKSNRLDPTVPYETVKLNKENPLDKYNIRGELNKQNKLKNFKYNIKPTDSTWLD